MAYDGSLKFDTSLDTSGFQKGGNKLTDFVKGIGAFKLLEKGFQMVATSIDSAVSRVDTLNKFPRVMEQMGYGAEAGSKSIQKLSDGIQGLPTTLDGMVSSTQRLAIATGNLDKGTDTALALNNALLASGASSADAARGTEQYIQALSRGKIDAQEWKTLMETMPYAMQKVAEAFGYTGTNAVQQLQAALGSGEVTMTQFNEKLIALNGGVGGFAEVAQTASGGIATSWANVQTAVVRGTANVIQAVDNGLAKFGGIAGVMDSVKGAVNVAFTAISSGANLLMQNLDKVALSAIGVGTAFAAYKAIDTWRTAAKNAADIAAEAAKTQTALTLSVGKSTHAKLELAAAEAKEAAAAAVAEARKAKQNATTLAAAAAEAKERAARVGGIAAQEAQNASVQAHVAASNAATTAKLAQTKAQTASTAATAANKALIDQQNASMGLGTAVVGYFTGSITLQTLATAAATAAATLFNIALKAIPFVAVAAVIGAVVAGLVALVKWLAAGSKEYQQQKEEVTALTDAQEALAASTEESAGAYKTNATEIAATATVSKDLVRQLRDVQASTGDAEDRQRRMASTVDQLNASVEGLNLAYDEETGAIRNVNTGQEISLDQLEQLVDAKAELAQANAWTARYNELIQEQTRIQEDLAVIEAKKQEIMANTNLNAREQEKLINELDEAAEGHATTMADVEMRLGVVNENLATSNTTMAESVVSDYDRMEQAVTSTGENIADVAAQWGVSVDDILAAMERENISLDDWVAKQEDAWADYEASVQKKTKGVINSFKEIPGEYDQSAQEMLDILISNKERYAEWESTMEEITRQLGPTAAAEFASLGPEATSAMQEILGSAELLDEYRDVFGVKLDEVTGLAVEDWNDPNFIGAPSDAIDTSAQLVTQNTALDTAVVETMEGARAAAEAVDFSGTGQVIGDGLIAGLTSAIQGGSGQITSAVTNMSTSVQNTFKTMSTQSQSTVTQMMTSINSTIVSRTSAIKSSITSMGNSITTALNTAKTQAVNVTTQMMTSINSAIVSRTSTIKTSMTACANGVVTAVTDMKTKAVAQSEQMMTGINSAIVTRTSTVKSSATAVANGIVEGLKSMIAGAETAANNMMDGIGRAMDNKAQGLYAKARAIADKIAATLRDAWDEHSPSRVSYKIMEFFMQAMYNAMGDMSGLLYNKADDVADGLTSRLTLSPDVLADQLRAMTDASYLGGNTLLPLAAGAGGGGGVSYSTNLVQNITTPKPLSASEMTREGQDLLRRQRWQLP